MENFVEWLFPPSKVDMFYNYKNILKNFFSHLYVDNTLTIIVGHLFVDKIFLKMMFFHLYVDNTLTIKVDHLFVDKMS